MPHQIRSSQSVRAMHTTLRRWKLEVQRRARKRTNHEVRSRNCPAAGAANPRESTSHPVWCSRPDCFSTRSQDGCTTFLHVFVADLERHLSCKQAHVGANPTEGSISNTLHVVTVSIPRCERGGAGATPAVGTISSSCARQRAEPAVCKTALPSASLGRTSTFHRIRESQRTHLVWDQEAPGAAPGYPTISLVCSSAVEHQAHNLKRAGSNPAGPTISKQPCSSM